MLTSNGLGERLSAAIGVMRNRRPAAVTSRAWTSSKVLDTSA